MTGIGAPAAEPAAAPAAPGTTAPAAAPAAAPAGPGASQPGLSSPDGLQLAVIVSAWQDSEFLLATLPRQQAEFEASGHPFNVATNPREAMDLAYELEQHLPLPASAFVNFDLGSRLSASPPLAVVAEKVLRVPDTNRPPHCRIDIFCYMHTGEVVRYHPGRSPQGDMQPHIMLPGCNLFDAALARSRGVGAALHLRPPRLEASSGATQPGGLLCTRGHDSYLLI